MKNHKLHLEHNGERSREESCWTGYCLCGWSESCHLKRDTQLEYSWHLDEAKKHPKGILERYADDKLSNAFYFPNK